MLPLSMFISRQSVRILENKSEVLVTCRQVPDPRVQVQVPSTTSLLVSIENLQTAYTVLSNQRCYLYPRRAKARTGPQISRPRP